ncbi:hypothetical protein PENSTE_c028G03196 [Penicillium steckii]|uniref:Phosphoglycerate mutase-like protein n=1 Tax=Penicillium steckii TaxID=303698 RepID=A0A1V6SPC4_9EURO|nr:hypothetical protein PENSTE_c028G03196 [Penicillium steckii]
MVYRLHLVRHGQATHNPNHDITIPDPPLTETGIQQSIKLNEDFPYHQNVGLVITSPLRRTLQTAIIGFSTCLDGGTARLSLEPEIQAHSSRPCDTGSTVECLQIEFPDLRWSELDQGLGDIYPAKKGIYATDVESLEKRGGRAQGLLLREFKRLEGTGREDIVVVSHGGFLGYISGHREGIPNSRWRTFLVDFDDYGRISAKPIPIGLE